MPERDIGKEIMDGIREIKTKKKTRDTDRRRQKEPRGQNESRKVILPGTSEERHQSESANNWTEDVTRDYLDTARYFIPARDHQIQVIIGLLADLSSNAAILELCCGEGLLAQKILESYPDARVQAMDGSPEMLKRAKDRLARFGDRVTIIPFNLAFTDWRSQQVQFNSVVSSLAIHHLPGEEKRILFKDIYKMLFPGGIFIVADVMEVVGSSAKRAAADEWDRIVREKSLQVDGNLKMYDFFIREGWNMHRYLDPEDIDKPSPLFDQLKWLEEAGFVEINVCWSAAGFAIICGRKPE